MKSPIFALAFFSLTLPAFGQGVDPLIGTWKYNPAKSTTTDEVPKNWTMTFTGEGQTLINTAEGMDDQGRPFKTILKHIYDGKPYPVTGDDAFDTNAFTRVGNTINGVRFKNGKVVEVIQSVIVPGKTFTGTYEGIDPNGQPYHGVRVFDRQ
jgi:hypothetical protein